MIVLTEQIEIPASYEKLKAWTANFEEEFVKWSPYHIECNLYNGNYHAGSKVRFREIVMGLDYDVTGTITECEQDENHFRIVFRSDKKTAFITFEGKRTKTGCHFSHTEAFGMTTPVIGAFMNFLIFKVFFRKKANWQLIRDDMILDNRYLYDILTEGKYPERIPLDKLLTATTNLTLEELQHPQDTPHARIYDRLTSMCAPVRFTGSNFRKETAQEKLERLKQLMKQRKESL